MTEQGHVDDLVAPYVLGALEPDELDWVEAHLAACPTCRLAVEEAAEVVDLLAFAAPELAPPSQVRSDLFARINNVVPAPRARPRSTTAWWSHWWRPVAIAASLGLILVLTGTTVMMQMQLESAREETRTLAPRATQEAQIVSFLATSEATKVSLRSPTDQSAASGTLLLDYEQSRLMLMATQLPPLPRDMSYQIWLAYENERFSAGLFQPRADGVATHEMTMPDYMPLYRWIFVTVEPAGGSAEPTGAIVLTGMI
jgi:anti-sigma-K factor RskA